MYQLMDSTCRPLVSEATALPTEPQPLSSSYICLLYSLDLDDKIVPAGFSIVVR